MKYIGQQMIFSKSNQVKEIPQTLQTKKRAIVVIQIEERQ
jgi:hypothetical protein